MSEILFAPIQGYTDAIYRSTHASLFGGISEYFTPFIRMENGEIRRHDLQDITSDFNKTLIEENRLTPQLMAGNANELKTLTEVLIKAGYHKIDINWGCPFPMITKKHKGSGILPYPEEAKKILDALNEYKGYVEFSIKMRLGQNSTVESMNLLPLLNAAPLRRITVHARLGSQQYHGTTDRESFSIFANECSHPVIYNGDILTKDDIERTYQITTKIEGIMIGRGLLANPALAEKGNVNDDTKRLLQFHNTLVEKYKSKLSGGEAQLLCKLKTIWDYFLPDIDKHMLKKIKKSHFLDEYQSNVTLALSQYNKGGKR
jgi:tRNA-dihydrouridine synthase